MSIVRSVLKKNTFIYHTWKIYKTYPSSSKFLASYMKNGARRIRNRFAGRLPIPDPYLVYLVAGTDDVDWFLHAGKMGAICIRDVLESNDISFDEIDAILDFGCGVGRVLRHFYPASHTNFYGTDINELLISWSQKNLKFANFQVNPLAGKLNFEDEKFDLIYAFSVFTHLTESLQFHWLKELLRILKPNGYLLITTHGDYYQKELQPADLEKYRKGELVVYNSDQEGSNYCAAFHPYNYVQNTLATGLKMIAYIPEGAAGNPRQDLYLLQK